MKKSIPIFALSLLMAFTVSCVNKKADSSDIKLVTADEMKQIIELEDVQVVDVRTASEFEAIRVKSAQNIDFNSPTFDKDIQKLDKSKPVVLYCKGGGRSAKCAKKLKDAGLEKIYDLEGGLSKWEHSKILNIEKKS